jgi:hypothetical protein
MGGKMNDIKAKEGKKLKWWWVETIYVLGGGHVGTT